MVVQLHWYPLGMSGTRLVITATRELKTRWTLCTLHDVCRCWTRRRTDFGKLKLIQTVLKLHNEERGDGQPYNG